MDAETQGVAYLLHFDTPLHHAQHYLGWTNDLPARLRVHTRGDRSKCVLTAVIAGAGIGFQLVRTWEGPLSTEKALKRRKNNRLLCPICNPRVKL